LALPSWLQRQQSVVVRPSSERLNRAGLEKLLKELGADGRVARDLDSEVDREMVSMSTLSSLTSALAVDYMDRLARPIPSLTPEIGAQIVGRAYTAHMVVEADPGRYGAPDVPVWGTLPPLKKGRPPQDLLSRAVKVSRGRTFPPICALTPAGWNGFVLCLTRRAHDLSPGGPDGPGFASVEVVDGVARFGWVLRQVDLHYGLEPERS
jgi:hypothetical protein